MTERPAIKAGDWITFGNDRRAVVCNVFDEGSFADIEIVYLYQGDLTITDYMVWRDDKWVFKFPTGDGDYALRVRRLSEFVEQLKRDESAESC